MALTEYGKDIFNIISFNYDHDDDVCVLGVSSELLSQAKANHRSLKRSSVPHQFVFIILFLPSKYFSSH